MFYTSKVIACIFEYENNMNIVLFIQIEGFALQRPTAVSPYCRSLVSVYAQVDENLLCKSANST